MRNLYFVLFVALLFGACKPSENNGKTEKANGKRVEISPYMESVVVLRDTTTIKTAYLQSDSGRMAMFQYEQNNGNGLSFLNVDQFKVLKNSIWQLIFEPGTNIYDDIFSPPLTSKGLKDKLIECDSIIESDFDASGKETVKAMWCCDSVSLINRINMLKFYEAWYYNPNSKMVEKDLLGYTVFTYNDQKRAFKYLFSAFRDKDAVKLAQKKWSW